MNMENCEGVISRVLTDENMTFLLDLYKKVGRPIEADMIATLSSVCSNSCEFFTTWGYTNYCTNPTPIMAYVQNNIQ